MTLLQDLGAKEVVDWPFPDFSSGLGSWMCAGSSALQVERVVL